MDYAADFESLPGKATGFVGGNLSASYPGEAQVSVQLLQKELDNAKLRAAGGFPSGSPVMSPVSATDYAADWERLPTPKASGEQNVKANADATERLYVKNAVENSPFSDKKVLSTLDTMGSDLGAGATNLVTGIGASIVGGYRGLSELAQGNSLNDAVNAVRSAQQGGTYQPTSEGGQKVVQALQSPANPMNWIGMGAKKAGEIAQDVGASPLVATGIETGINAAALLGGRAALNRPLTIPKLPGGMLTDPAAIAALKESAPAAEFGSVGAAAASRGSNAQALLAGASPELQSSVKGVKEINTPALERQVQADSLPVPIRLTKGQATQDPVQISFEQNNRGKMPELAQRFNEQSPQLHENLTAVRDQVAPDVYAVKPTENAQAIIDGYKAKDAILNQDISAKYKALETAAGGNFPMDAKAFVQTADAALAKKLKTDFVPGPIAKQLDQFREGAPMTFEQFEAMRTNLAAEMRKAARSGDGNAEYASSLVRDALENMPLTPEAAQLKPLADAARNAAKARFDLLRKDPAYQAAVNDVAPDKFVNKYIVGAPVRDVNTMVQNLGAGTPEHQAIAAAVINHLKERAGNETNNFSQAGYNKALSGLSEKLPTIVGPQATKTLQDIGEVARNTVFQPRGSFVNNSNTLTGALAEHAKGFAEGAANKVLGFGLVPVGSLIRGVAAKRAANQAVTESLQTGAGIALKDIGK